MRLMAHKWGGRQWAVGLSEISREPCTSTDAWDGQLEQVMIGYESCPSVVQHNCGRRASSALRVGADRRSLTGGGRAGFWLVC